MLKSTLAQHYTDSTQSFSIVYKTAVVTFRVRSTAKQTQLSHIQTSD